MTTTTAPATSYRPDKAAVEFAQLCDAAIIAGEDELRRLLMTEGSQYVLDKVAALVRDLHMLKVRAETGTLRRPSQGAGLGLGRDTGELAVSDRFEDAARTIDTFYRTQM